MEAGGKYESKEAYFVIADIGYVTCGINSMWR